MKMRLQLALDAAEHLAPLPVLASYFDIVEVGTPLLKRFGVAAARRAPASMVAADGTRRWTADRSDAAETPRKQHHEQHHRHDYRREQHHTPHARSLVLRRHLRALATA